MDKSIVSVLIEDNFNIDETYDELVEFIYNNNLIRNILKVNKFISQYIEKETNVRLIRLFDGGDDWFTVFLEINVDLDWIEWSDINDKVLEYMFNNNMVNINLTHENPDIVLPTIDKMELEEDNIDDIDYGY